MDKKKQVVLSDFQILRPEYESTQEETLHWLLAAHTKAEEGKGGNEWTEELQKSFQDKLQERLWHVACKPDKISKRGHAIPDFLHRDWKSMEIYSLEKEPAGANLSLRQKAFDGIAEKVFARYYATEDSPPHDLIHVTCTGYVAPSGAQKLVSQKNWGDATTVTHAYHMGCHGAISALRIANGFVQDGSEEKRADIVHTEICSLHTNPSMHGSDQLVAQSLFADGFIKYSAHFGEEVQKPHLKILAVHEKIIPNSTNAMTWNLADWGFQISLAKEIPVLIARALPSYMELLCKKGGKKLEDVVAKAYFAIHPGGPKILQQIQDFFHLTEGQIKTSRDILYRYGNMSSATIPHIWESLLQDKTVPKGSLVVSLAFGPGLSICGALLEKGGG